MSEYGLSDDDKREIRETLDLRAQWYGRINGHRCKIVATGARGRYADPVRYIVKVGDSVETVTGEEWAVMAVDAMSLPASPAQSVIV